MNCDVRLARERRLDDRQDRRDAAARGERDVVALRRLVERDVEVPHRRHDVERVAGLQLLVRPRREHAARRALDRDPQLVVLHGRADRVRATHVLSVDDRAQRQVLALRVAELLAQRLRARRT